VRIIKMVSDEEYKASGQSYPGQPYTGRLRAIRDAMIALKAGKTTPQEVREALLNEEEMDEAEEDSAAIKFPKEKSSEQTKLEAQLEELLKEAESKREEPKEGASF
jgi:tyrosyl-tRNA synthetase